MSQLPWRLLAGLWMILLLAVAGAVEDDAARRLRLAVWQRGLDVCWPDGCSPDTPDDEALAAVERAWLSARHLPIARLRGGDGGCGATTCEPAVATDLDALRAELGPEFAAALTEAEAEHDAECDESCKHFYCGEGDGAAAPPKTRKLSMGSVPPEDFASTFNFPLDLIQVTDTPLIPPEEAEAVVANAVKEGVYNNEFPSGKYKLGGDWVKKLPSALEWFNRRLAASIFPAAAAYFPEIVSSAAQLRAHSVAILKYNASHPRTDVHVDDGILALTLALSPRANYTGGGTYFEHMGHDQILEMEQGHATLRPGSVRHGGHAVSAGDRYILGAFLLIADRVEYVRRLNNLGRAARGRMDLPKARKLFKWAVRINPHCATCLKNWAEAISATAAGATTAISANKGAAAEEKLRRAIDLLPEDSDAWYSLGVLLSRMGRKAEAIQAYEVSVGINADDHDLLYNLATLLGDAGRTPEEVKYLRMAIAAKPDFGRAWGNLGVALASSGDVEGAGPAFISAVEYAPDQMNLMNLARWYMVKGEKAKASAVLKRAETAPPAPE